MRLKKIIILAGIVLTLASLSMLILFFADEAFSADPPVETVTIYDKEQYMQFNSYVANAIKSDFSQTLPQAIPEQASITNYVYSYRCALFGDPTFSVMLELKYAERAVFEREMERLHSLENSVAILADSLDKKLICIDSNLVSIEKYLDKEVFDGLSFSISCAEIDEKNMTITYCIASLWDGCICEESTKQFIASVAQIYRKTEDGLREPG